MLRAGGRAAGPPQAAARAGSSASSAPTPPRPLRAAAPRAPHEAGCAPQPDREGEQPQRRPREPQQQLQQRWPAAPAAAGGALTGGARQRRRAALALGRPRACGGDAGERPPPEPPAASGAPPARAGGGAAPGPDPEPPALGERKPAAATGGDEELDVEAAVDAMLDRTWQGLKRDLKKELSPEQAAMLDSWRVSDIQSDRVFRDIAEQQLGPILELMGIREDPYDFFVDLFKTALALQLLSGGLAFYGAQLGAGLDAGGALRCVAGLALGYGLRLGIKIEQLAWPMYNAVVQLLLRGDAVYEVPRATPEERRDTLNRLGLAVGAALVLPKAALGWTNDECAQMVLPMLAGLFCFDLAYIAALLIKLWGHEDRQ
ncbi:hypothetical protein HT031_004157 [Scenedesmus sp. PABB004]|nr:hypothetical protein HT031_004157 [Scenedesmus sp. PABB004]